MGNKIHFIVDGEPKGKGRPRFSRIGGFIRTYTPKETVDYENKIRDALKSENLIGCPLSGCIKIKIIANFGIPKSTSKKRAKLMLDNLMRPTKKPDIDNISKIVLDSLNKVCYLDDSQVCELAVGKFYSEKPCIEITLEEINELQDY